MARQGFREVRLHTNDMMVENVAPHTALGYRETDRRPYRGRGIVFMRKPVVGLHPSC